MCIFHFGSRPQLPMNRKFKDTGHDFLRIAAKFYFLLYCPRLYANPTLVMSNEESSDLLTLEIYSQPSDVTHVCEHCLEEERKFYVFRNAR